MQSRPDPDPPDRFANRERLARTPRVKKALRSLRSGHDVDTSELSETELAFVIEQTAYAAWGKEGRLGAAIWKATRDTTPVLRTPKRRSRELIEDLETIWAQPEMLDFWAQWTVPPALRGSRGPTANYWWAKVLAAVMASTGISAHVDDIDWVLGNMGELQDIFVRVDHTARERVAARGERCDEALPYQRSTQESALRLLGGGGLGQMCRAAANKAKAAQTLAVRQYHPSVGRRWLMDGSLAPSWVQQVGRREGPDEAWVRRRAPYAGARAIAYSRRGGKLDVPSGARLSASQRRSYKFVRGLAYVPLIEQAAGLCGPSVLQEAGPTQETEAMAPLLDDLYLYNPQLEVEDLVADSAWDVDRWCELAVLNYRIRPIFRLHNPKTLPLTRKEHQGGRIIQLSGTGQGRCSRHPDVWMEHDSCEFPNREGLEPGERYPRPGEYAVRLRCPHCKDGQGERLHLRMSVSWRRLAYYPHHPLGRPDLYAHRKVMLRRLRTQVESHFQRIHAAHKLLTPGADRLRLTDFFAIEALVNIAELTINAFITADQRERHGDAPPPLLPTPPLAPPRRVGRPRGPGRPSNRLRVPGEHGSSPATSSNGESPPVPASAAAGWEARFAEALPDQLPRGRANQH